MEDNPKGTEYLRELEEQEYEKNLCRNHSLRKQQNAPVDQVHICIVQYWMMEAGKNILAKQSYTNLNVLLHYYNVLDYKFPVFLIINPVPADWSALFLAQSH